MDSQSSQEEKHKDEKLNTEKPKTEKPKTEKPKSEKPKSEKPKTEKPKNENPKKKQPAAAAKAKADKGNDKDTHLLGITAKKIENFSDWYSQVLTKSQMIDYYDISGCYILRPWAYGIWEEIQRFFDSKIKPMGVENAYFPLLVSEKSLATEKDHIEGFSAEVAWVTRAGSELAHPVAIRPTSETIMYPAFAQWIRSHRDLPFKVNQWTNVVRWEFKHPVPFIRSREFLWQEGHTVFATLEEASKEVLEILEIYSKVYEELLAVPVYKGYKSVGEKFAGGYYTTSIEAFIPANGRAVQAATSHCLGQNFSKMFNIKFEDEAKNTQHAWQNSWGLSTRAIGVMTMVHGDDKGLVLPPRVAPIQVVLIPISFKNTTNTAEVEQRARELTEEFVAAGIRIRLDDRQNYHPGWKYNHWELKGVPLRVEIGPKDFENKTVVAVRRDTGAKITLSQENLAQSIKSLLDEIQTNLLETARKSHDGRIKQALDWASFMDTLEAGIAEVPWCEAVTCEEEVKKRSGEDSKRRARDADAEEGFGLTGSAKSLCIPLNQKPLPEDFKCFCCGAKATKWTLFGRSY